LGLEAIYPVINGIGFKLFFVSGSPRGYTGWNDRRVIRNQQVGSSKKPSGFCCRAFMYKTIFKNYPVANTKRIHRIMIILTGTFLIITG